MYLQHLVSALCFEAMLLPSPFSPLAQAAPNLSFSLTPTSNLGLPHSFCLGESRRSSGYFPEDQTQGRQPVPQCRQQHSTEEEYCSTGVAAAWHLKNVQVSELAGVVSARCDTAKGRDIRQPWKELFVPALGSSYASHIFLLCFERSRGRAVFVKGMSEGNCWGEWTP